MFGFVVPLKISLRYGITEATVIIDAAIRRIFFIISIIPKRGLLKPLFVE